MTKPIITLIRGDKSTNIFVDGTIEGEFDFGFINGAAPLLQAIRSLCLDSKAACQNLDCKPAQYQQDDVLADRILELIQNYGQWLGVQGESKK